MTPRAEYLMREAFIHSKSCNNPLINNGLNYMRGEKSQDMDNSSDKGQLNLNVSNKERSNNRSYISSIKGDQNFEEI